MRFVIFWVPNKSANKIFSNKTPYTPPVFQKKICTLHRRIFWKHPLFTTFLLVLTVDEVYQPPNNLATSIILSKRLYKPLSFRTKVGARHRKHFSKHPLFTTFSLVLKISEVCNISDKCWLLSKSANKMLLQKAPYTPPLFQKNFVLSIAESFRDIHFLPQFY